MWLASLWLYNYFWDISKINYDQKLVGYYVDTCSQFLWCFIPELTYKAKYRPGENVLTSKMFYLYFQMDVLSEKVYLKSTTSLREKFKRGFKKSVQTYYTWFQVRGKSDPYFYTRAHLRLYVKGTETQVTQ